MRIAAEYDAANPLYWQSVEDDDDAPKTDSLEGKVKVTGLSLIAEMVNFALSYAHRNEVRVSPVSNQKRMFGLFPTGDEYEPFTTIKISKTEMARYKDRVDRHFIQAGLMEKQQTKHIKGNLLSESDTGCLSHPILP